MSVFTSFGTSSGGGPITVNIQGATTPAISQVLMPTANTEYSFTFPADCKQFQVKLQSDATLKVAYVLGDSGSLFLTVPRYCFYAESNLTLPGTVTLYFQCTQPSQVLEVLTWV